LIVGLGNPGREYQRTPHNVGFVVAEELAARWALRQGKDRFRARIAEGRVRAHAPHVGAPGAGAAAAPRVAVLCPQTFMNDAGRSVGPARGAFKLPLQRLLVVHDDIDLPFGEVRTRLGGGLAGHNGLKSLKRELGSADFMRVRAGVGRPQSTDPEIVSAYVLGRFRQSPQEVRELVQRAADAVEQVVLDAGQAGAPAPDAGGPAQAAGGPAQAAGGPAPGAPA